MTAPGRPSWLELHPAQVQVLEELPARRRAVGSHLRSTGSENSAVSIQNRVRAYQGETDYSYDVELSV